MKLVLLSSTQFAPSSHENWKHDFYLALVPDMKGIIISSTGSFIDIPIYEAENGDRISIYRFVREFEL